MSDLGVCEFAEPGPLRERLISAVLSGSKTATSSLLAEWRENEEQLPAAGERQRVLDSDGETVAIIELLSVEVLELADVTDRHAEEEGEGFASARMWRAAHEDFWRAGERGSERLADETLIVFERFRLC